MTKLSLKRSEQVRRETTQKQQKDILRMYRQLFKDVEKQADKLSDVNPRKQNLVMLQREIDIRMKQINKDIESGIVRSMRTVSSEVTEDVRTFLKLCGFREKDIHSAFLYVPELVVQNVKNGNIYAGNWTLSKAIWGHSKKIQGDIEHIISYGSAQGKSAYEVAKDIEKYVNPSLKKESRVISFKKYARGIDGKLIKDADGNYIPSGKPRLFYFGEVDYNAQRLARTMISHAYQQAFETVNENNPFVESYIWHSAGLHGRTCQICLDRDGKHFKKSELPLDHPNGMCTFEAYIPDSMDDIADRIGRWYKSPAGTDVELDKYAKDFLL